MAEKKRRKAKPVVQELDMVEHASRLRALQPESWEILKKGMAWLAALVLISALAWLALAR